MIGSKKLVSTIDNKSFQVSVATSAKSASALEKIRRLSVQLKIMVRSLILMFLLGYLCIGGWSLVEAQETNIGKEGCVNKEIDCQNDPYIMQGLLSKRLGFCEEALLNFRKSNSAYANRLAGEMVANGLSGCKRDTAEGMRLLRLAARSGDAEAHLHIISLAHRVSAIRVIDEYIGFFKLFDRTDPKSVDLFNQILGRYTNKFGRDLIAIAQSNSLKHIPLIESFFRWNTNPTAGCLALATFFENLEQTDNTVKNQEVIAFIDNIGSDTLIRCLETSKRFEISLITYRVKGYVPEKVKDLLNEVINERRVRSFHKKMATDFYEKAKKLESGSGVVIDFGEAYYWYLKAAYYGSTIAAADALRLRPLLPVSIEQQYRCELKKELAISPILESECF